MQIPAVIADRAGLPARRSPKRLGCADDVDEEHGGRDRDHARGQPVESVDQVDRVGDEDDPDDRQDDGEVARRARRSATIPWVPKGRTNHANCTPSSTTTPGEKICADELGEGPRAPRVVDRAETHHERASDERGRERLRARRVQLARRTAGTARAAAPRGTRRTSRARPSWASDRGCTFRSDGWSMTPGPDHERAERAA